MEPAGLGVMRAGRTSPGSRTVDRARRGGANVRFRAKAIDALELPSVLPPLLALVLRDFCHVEWWEVDELRELVSTGNAHFDTERLEGELTRIAEDHLMIPVLQINDLTGNEFQNQEEAREWLAAIHRAVFGR